MPKVIIFAPMVGRGGMSRLVQKLIAEWSKNKTWKFHVLSQPRDEFGNEINWGKATFTALGPALPKHPQLFNALTKAIPAYYAQLKAAITEIEPDLIFLPSGWWTMRGVEWDIQIPTVAFIPDFAMDYLPEFMVADEFMPYRAEAFQLARAVKTLITPSKYQADNAGKYGFKNVKVIYHNGFIPEPFDTSQENADIVRKKYKLPPTYTLAFHAAGHKDPETILRAQHIARRIARVPSLVIAGIDTGEYKPHVPTSNMFASRIQNIIRREIKATIGTDLFILGEVPVEDIGGLYAASSLAITASRSEGGLSGSICEAAASKTPLIYSDFPVMQERLVDGLHGVCFPVGNPLELALAIARVYQNPISAVERAEALFLELQTPTWSDVAKSYLDIFKESLTDGKPTV